MGSLGLSSPSGTHSSRSLRPGVRVLGQMGQWFLQPTPLDEHWVGDLSGQVDVEPPYTHLADGDMPQVDVLAIEYECNQSAADLLAVPRGLVGAHRSAPGSSRMLHRSTSTGRSAARQAERFSFPRRAHWRKAGSKHAPELPPCGSLLLSIHATQQLQLLYPPKVVNGKRIKPKRSGEYFASIRVGRVELFGAELPLRAHPSWPAAVSIPLERLPTKLSGAPLHLDFYKRRGGELLGSVDIPVAKALLYGFEATCDHNRDPPSGLSRGVSMALRAGTASSSQQPRGVTSQSEHSHAQYPGQSASAPEPLSGAGGHDTVGEDNSLGESVPAEPTQQAEHTHQTQHTEGFTAASPQVLHAASRYDPYFQLHMPDAVDVGDGPQWLVIADVFGRSGRSTRPAQVQALPKVKLGVAWRPPMDHPHFSAAVRAQLSADDTSGGVGPLEPQAQATESPQQAAPLQVDASRSSLPRGKRSPVRGGSKTRRARSKSRSPKKKATSPQRSGPPSPRKEGGVTQHVVVSPYGQVKYTDAKELAARKAAIAARSQSRARQQARRRRLAATRIQAGVRMVLAKNATAALKQSLFSAATSIQSVQRGRIARAQVVAMRRAASAADVVVAGEDAARRAILDASEARSKRRERIQAARAKDKEPSLKSQKLQLAMPGGRVNVQLPATHTQLRAMGKLLAPSLVPGELVPALHLKSEEDVEPEHMLLGSALALLLGHGQLSVDIVSDLLQTLDVSALAESSHPTDFPPEARHAASLLLIRHPFQDAVRAELLLKRKSEDAYLPTARMLASINSGTDASAGTLRDGVFVMAVPQPARRSSDTGPQGKSLPSKAPQASLGSQPADDDADADHDFVIPSTIKGPLPPASVQPPPARRRVGRKGKRAAAVAAAGAGRAAESKQRKAKAAAAAARAAAAVRSRVSVAALHRWLACMAFWRPPAQLDASKLTPAEQDAVDLREMKSLQLDEDLLNGIRAVMGDISPGHFMRVADIRDPPVEVTAVGAALCALLGIKPAGWESVKRVLSRSGFGKKLTVVHPSLLTKTAQRTARSVLRQHPRHHTDFAWALARLQKDSIPSGRSSPRSQRADGSVRRLGAHSVPIDALHLWALFMAFWLPDQDADLHGSAGVDVPEEIVEAFRKQGYKNPKEAAAAAAAAAAAEYSDGGDLAAILTKKGLNLSREHLAVFMKYFHERSAPPPQADSERSVSGHSVPGQARTGAAPVGRIAEGAVSPASSLYERADRLLSPRPTSLRPGGGEGSSSFETSSQRAGSISPRDQSVQRSLSPSASPPAKARRPSDASQFVHMRVRLISDATWATVAAAAAAAAKGGFSPGVQLSPLAADSDDDEGGSPGAKAAGSSAFAFPPDADERPSLSIAPLSPTADKDVAPQVSMEHSRKLLGEALASTELRSEATVGMDASQGDAAAAVVAAVWAACAAGAPSILQVAAAASEDIPKSVPTWRWWLALVRTGGLADALPPPDVPLPRRSASMVASLLEYAQLRAPTQAKLHELPLAMAALVQWLRAAVSHACGGKPAHKVTVPMSIHLRSVMGTVSQFSPGGTAPPPKSVQLCRDAVANAWMSVAAVATLAEARMFLGQWRRKPKLKKLLSAKSSLGRAKRGVARLPKSGLASLASLRPFPSAAADAVCALSELFGQDLTPAGTHEVLLSDTLQRALISIKPKTVQDVPYALHRVRAWLLLSGSEQAFLEDCIAAGHPSLLCLGRWLLALSKPVTDEVQTALNGGDMPGVSAAIQSEITSALAVADASKVSQLQQAMTAEPIQAMPAWATAVAEDAQV